MDIAAQRRMRRYVHKIPDQTFMVYRSACVYNAMLSDLRVCLYDRPMHYDTSRTDPCRRGNNGLRMNRTLITQRIFLRYQFPDPV